MRRFGRSDNLLILKKPFDNVEVLQLAHALTKKWQVTRQAALRIEEMDVMVRQRTQELQRDSRRPFTRAPSRWQSTPWKKGGSRMGMRRSSG